MKIVIDIPENTFKILKYQQYCDVDVICKSIFSGTPLPKQHGRLKDIDAFITKVKADRKHSVYLRSWTADDVLNALNNTYAPTIIEAESDKEE